MYDEIVIEASDGETMKIGKMEPKDFYFQTANDEGEDYIMITPKEIYDKSHNLHDMDCIDTLIESVIEDDRFYNAMEATFEFDGLIEDAVKVLKEKGFVEHEMFTL